MMNHVELLQTARDHQEAARSRATTRRLLRAANQLHLLRSLVGERFVLAAATMITDPVTLERVADDLTEKAHCYSPQAA